MMRSGVRWMCGSGMKLAGGRSWCERSGELELGVWRGGGDGGAACARIGDSRDGTAHRCALDASWPLTGATHETVAGITVLSQVQAHTTRVADRTAKSKLLIDMRVLLCGATVLRRFGYSKSRYFALLPRRKRRPPPLIGRSEVRRGCWRGSNATEVDFTFRPMDWSVFHSARCGKLAKPPICGNCQGKGGLC